MSFVFNELHYTFKTLILQISNYLGGLDGGVSSVEISCVGSHGGSSESGRNELIRLLLAFCTKGL